MRKLIQIVLAITFLLSCLWAYNVRDYEPFIAMFSSLAAFAGLWLTDKKSKTGRVMKQKNKGNSVGYQAGGDIRIQK